MNKQKLIQCSLFLNIFFKYFELYNLNKGYTKNYIELNITMLNKLINLEELLDESQKLRDKWLEEKVRKNIDKMKTSLQEISQFQEDRKNKNENLKKAYTDFQKKYS